MDRIKMVVPAYMATELQPDAFWALNNTQQPRNGGSKPYFKYRYSRNGYVIEIDVCVPKSLFGNSLVETSNGCLDCLVELIRHEAKNNNIAISAFAIRRARVWYLEYGKNIILKKYHSMNACLNNIALCLAEWAQQLADVKYYSNIGNKGHKVALITQGYEVSFYDKATAGIYNSTTADKAIFTAASQNNIQVLRYEVKLYNATFVKAQIRSIDPANPCTLESVFSSSLEQNLLSKFWQPIEQTLPHIKSKRSRLIRQIDAAAKNGCSLLDLLYVMGIEDMEKRLGATLFRRTILQSSVNPKVKQRLEQQLTAFKSKRTKLKRHFKYKKMYITRTITRYITTFKPIWIDANGDIVGIL